MKKYERMVKLNRRENLEKEAMAIETINEMTKQKEGVTIPKLVEATGLSRSYFYKNQKVRERINWARGKENQKLLTESKKISIDKVLEIRLQILKKENQKYKKLLREKEMEIAILKGAYHK